MNEEEDTRSPSERIIHFFELVGTLKALQRQGWVRKRIHDGESVADHMYRMAMLTFLIDDKCGVDRVKCMEMALVHDLAECVVGDITPADNIPEEAKKSMEMDAMKGILKNLPDYVANKILSLFIEYEQRITKESKLVKELDAFEFYLQTVEYERGYDLVMDSFIRATEPKITTPWLVELMNVVKKNHEDFMNEEEPHRPEEEEEEEVEEELEEQLVVIEEEPIDDNDDLDNDLDNDDDDRYDDEDD